MEGGEGVCRSGAPVPSVDKKLPPISTQTSEPFSLPLFYSSTPLDCIDCFCSCPLVLLRLDLVI